MSLRVSDRVLFRDFQGGSICNLVNNFYQMKESLIETVYSTTTRLFSKERAEGALQDTKTFKRRLRVSCYLGEGVDKVSRALSRCTYLDLAFKESKQKKPSDVIDHLNLEVKKQPSEVLYRALCETTTDCLRKALEYLEGPLKAIIDPESQPILGKKEVRLPRSTMMFFKDALRGKFPLPVKDLNTGCCSKVVAVTLGGSSFACKEFHQEMVLQWMSKEVIGLMLLKHRNIIPIEAVSSGRIYLQLADNDIVDHCNINGELSLQRIKRCLQEVARALSYVHKEGFIHKDIKLDNILIMSSSVSKMVLCDFGFIACARGDNTLNGTYDYMAPELLNKRGLYSQKVDSFAFGILIWNLFVEKHPFNFDKLQHEKSVNRVRDHQGKPYIIEKRSKSFTNLTESGKQFIYLAAKCLHGDPEKRISMEGILRELDKIPY